jgi:putative oxidoreductase
LLRIKPSLTPSAATGLATIMIFALGFHVSKGEYFMIPMNLILASICLFIAWGRFKKAPIAPKS